MENFKQELKTKIGESLGAASMCWSETPTGIFESSRAEKIALKLEKFITDYTDYLI